jgi:hypothetical protein
VRDSFVHVLLRVSVNALLAQRAKRFGQEEVDPAEKAVELVLRLPDRLSHFARQRACKRVVGRDDPLAKPGDGVESLPDRNLGPAALAGARGLVFALDRRGVIGGDVGDDAACGGIDDLHGGSVLALAREGHHPGVALDRVGGCLVLRGSGEEFVENRRVVEK